MNTYRKAAKMLAKASDTLYAICKAELKASKTDLLAMKDFEKIFSYATELASLARQYQSKGVEETDETENV
jgi:hypothetical protein